MKWGDELICLSEPFANLSWVLTSLVRFETRKAGNDQLCICGNFRGSIKSSRGSLGLTSMHSPNPVAGVKREKALASVNPGCVDSPPVTAQLQPSSRHANSLQFGFASKEATIPSVSSLDSFRGLFPGPRSPAQLSYTSFPGCGSTCSDRCSKSSVHILFNRFTAIFPDIDNPVSLCLTRELQGILKPTPTCIRIISKTPVGAHAQAFQVQISRFENVVMPCLPSGRYRPRSIHYSLFCRCLLFYLWSTNFHCSAHINFYVICAGEPLILPDTRA
ncbi:hypothetical protein R3P38DRAFT_1281149 [Favolaschia claudopus]|uniref:Uncharacterized protein n=1 Tax=Favolaschia claudopus TaxID=2862362 RepID=A0AAW0AZV9_9AGAR